MITKAQLQKIEKLLEEIRDFVAGGKYIFRGEFRENNDVSSTFYREIKERMRRNPSVSDIKTAQKKMLKDVQNHTKKQDDNFLLEQLQHFGGSTNQIDFTTDYLIALFFACDGENNDSKGRLIFLDKKKFKRKIYEPIHPQNRVIAQKSVFIRSPSGLIKVNPDEIITIDEELKTPILRYLNQHHDINAHTIYNDIHGYITQRRIHKGNRGNFDPSPTPQNEPSPELVIKRNTQALERDPNSADAYNNRGVAYDDMGEHDLAIVDYDKAIELNPKHADAYYNRGNAYNNKDNYARAIADYNKAIDMNPNAESVYINRGIVYRKRGDYARAIADFNKAIELNLYAAAYNNRGIGYDKKDDNARAIADFNKAIELNLNDAVTYNNRGNAYSNKGDYARAIADFNKSIELNPNDAEVYNNRGGAYFRKGDYDLAIDDFNKAIMLNPNYAGSYYNRGNIYRNKGDYDLAIDDFNKAIELNPNYANAYSNRGVSKEDKQDYKGAREDLETALRLAEQQGDKILADLIQPVIDKLPPDSDS